MLVDWILQEKRPGSKLQNWNFPSPVCLRSLMVSTGNSDLELSNLQVMGMPRVAGTDRKG